MPIDWGDGLTTRARTVVIGALVLLSAGNAVALATIDGASSSPTEQVDPAAALKELPGLGAGDTLSTQPGVPPTTARPGAKSPGSRGAADNKAANGNNNGATPTPSQDATQPTPAPSAPYTYKVTLEPTCVAVGEDFTVTFHVEPGSAVGIIAAYADGNTHASMWAGNAGADGKAVRTWKAPPAPGWGQLLTGARTPDRRSGGTTLQFRIVELPGTCD